VGCTEARTIRGEKENMKYCNEVVAMAAIAALALAVSG